MRYKKDNQVLEIIQDETPLNPRKEWDNLGFMVCLHGRYDLGDKHEFNDHEDIKKYVTANKIKTILPLYLYDHSGITINTKPFSCPWDSGQIGYIWIEDDKIREEYSVKRISLKLRKRVLTYLKNEVETYDQYLTGNVYGFNLYEVETCNLDYDHEDFKDSCWGFYGTDWKNNGLLDHAGIDDLDGWDEI